MVVKDVSERYIIIAILAAAGCFLRAAFLGAGSYWLDELYSVCAATESSVRALFVSWVFPDNHPPTYFFLLRGWIDLFGIGETATRSLSMLFGIIAVFATALLSRTLFTTSERICSAAFLSTNIIAVYYSQEARSYSLLLMASTFTTIYYLKIVSSSPKVRIHEQTLFLIWCVITSLLHFYGMLLSGVLAGYLAVMAVRHNPRLALLYMAALMPAFLWLVIHEVFGGLLSHGSHDFYYPPISVSLLAVTGARYIISAHRGTLSVALSVLQSCCLAAMIVAALNSTNRPFLMARQSYVNRFLLVVLVLPILLAIAVSLWQPIFYYRNCIIALPALAFLFGRLAGVVLSKQRAWWSIPGYLAFGLLASAEGLKADKWTDLEPWRSAYAIIGTSSKPLRVITVLNYDNLAFRRANEFYANKFNLSERDTFVMVGEAELSRSVFEHADAIVILHGWRVIDRTRAVAGPLGFKECKLPSPDNHSALLIANNVELPACVLGSS